MRLTLVKERVAYAMTAILRQQYAFGTVKDTRQVDPVPGKGGGAWQLKVDEDNGQAEVKADQGGKVIVTVEVETAGGATKSFTGQVEVSDKGSVTFETDKWEPGKPMPVAVDEDGDGTTDALVMARYTNPAGRVRITYFKNALIKWTSMGPRRMLNIEGRIRSLESVAAVRKALGR